jgi:hypothetical protein
MNWKSVGGNGSGIIVRYYPPLSLEILRRTTE